MNTKRIATAFAVLAATTVSFSAFAASMDANALLQQSVDAPATLTFSKSGSGYVSTYRNNQLNAFDVLLNGRSYTFDLPAYTNGYQVKTASTYNRAGNGLSLIHI